MLSKVNAKQLAKMNDQALIRWWKEFNLNHKAESEKLYQDGPLWLKKRILSICLGFQPKELDECFSNQETPNKKVLDNAVKFLEKRINKTTSLDEITKVVASLPPKDRAVFWAVFNALNKKLAEVWYNSSKENAKLILDGLCITGDANLHPFVNVLCTIVANR